MKRRKGTQKTLIAYFSPKPRGAGYTPLMNPQARSHAAFSQSPCIIESTQSRSFQTQNALGIIQKPLFQYPNDISKFGGFKDAYFESESKFDRVRSSSSWVEFDRVHVQSSSSSIGIQVQVQSSSSSISSAISISITFPSPIRIVSMSSD